MDNAARIQQYISSQRNKGATDQAVRERLLSAGWPAGTVDKYLLPSNAPPNPQQLPTIPVSKQKTSRRLVLIGAVAGVTIMSVGGYLLHDLRRPTNQEATTTAPPPAWQDKNYSLNLVEGWRASTENSPNAGRNAFTHEALQASLIIYTTPSDNSEINSLDRALTNLQADNGQVTITKGETVVINDQPSDIQLIRVDYPVSQKNLAYLYVPYADTDYLLEATAPSDQWAAATNDIITMMKSFKPANKDIRRAQ